MLDIFPQRQMVLKEQTKQFSGQSLLHYCKIIPFTQFYLSEKVESSQGISICLYVGH